LTQIVYFNGEFVRAEDAQVSAFDGGWLHGAGLFETMRAEDGRVFRLDAHLARLRRSAHRILRPLEPDLLPGASKMGELLARNGLSAARLRLTVTAGSMVADAPENAPRPTVCVTAAPLAGYSPKLYEHGVRAALCDFRVSPSDPLAGHKTTSYLPRLLALREAQSRQCLEALWFTTQNRLAEGSISNVFIVSHGVLKTPPPDTPVLPGIARAVVLELARERSVEVQECAITGDDVLDADEVFLTNSIMQVMPVVAVEKHAIAGGKVGELARTFLAAYRNRVAQELRTATDDERSRL
jgi:branched-chain amino acid aminotransferase